MLEAGDAEPGPEVEYMSERKNRGDAAQWRPRTRLVRGGVTTQFVDGTDLAQWEEALSKPTRAVFLETPSNPMLDVIDLAAVVRLGHRVGARVVVDNVFAIGAQRPFELGADVVVYS